MHSAAKIIICHRFVMQEGNLSGSQMPVLSNGRMVLISFLLEIIT